MDVLSGRPVVTSGDSRKSALPPTRIRGTLGRKCAVSGAHFPAISSAEAWSAIENMRMATSRHYNLSTLLLVLKYTCIISSIPVVTHIASTYVT